MPDAPQEFDPQYVPPTGTKADATVEAEEPPPAKLEIDTERYGTGKPRRVTIRARISDDQD